MKKFPKPWYRPARGVYCVTLTANSTILAPIRRPRPKSTRNSWPIPRRKNWAVEQELIEHSPLAGMKKPKAGKRERVITDAEWQDILSLVQDGDLRDLLIVTWETGCRPQESLIVEARHVDLTNSRWVFAVAESKTDLPRFVYLTETALAITQRLVARYPRGPIFRNSTGEPWTTGLVQGMLFDQEEREKQARLDAMADELKQRFGTGAIRRGSSLRGEVPGTP